VNLLRLANNLICMSNTGNLVRKNAKSITDTQAQNSFKQAILSLINSGQYGKMVAYHGQMMKYKMHGEMGKTGALRFLPWHRVYLFELERMLKTSGSHIAIPYWDWANDHSIPQWLSDFTPTIIVNKKSIKVTRNPGASGDVLPTQPDVDVVEQKTTFDIFEQGLEFDLHNVIHRWVGGNMSDLSKAPSDPIFWLHHANVDRLWTKWQESNTGKNPELTGKNAIMTPWKYTEIDTRKTTNFYYTYDVL
jgi:tyrosinase